MLRWANELRTSWRAFSSPGDTSLTRASVGRSPGRIVTCRSWRRDCHMLFALIRRPKAPASPGPSVPTPSDSGSNLKTVLLGCTRCYSLRSICPVERVDDNDIAFTGLIQCLVQSGAVGGGSGFLINVNAFAGNTFLAQSVDLSVKVLFRGRHPGVASIHNQNSAGSPFCSGHYVTWLWHDSWDMLLLGLCIFNPLSLMVSHFLESETLGKGRKEPLSRCSNHCLKYKHSLVNIGVCLQRFPYPSPRRISVPPSGPSYSYPHWPRCRMKTG